MAKRIIPILVTGMGRSGTTAVMSLLASDPRIRFDRTYPFENRYLTYWAKLAILATRPGVRPEFDYLQLLNDQDCHFGTFPWHAHDGREASEPEPRLALPRERLFAELWQAFSRHAREVFPEAAFYAEKTPHWLKPWLPADFPARTIYLVRDPRDVFLSANAFLRGKGFDRGFGRERSSDDREHAISLAHLWLQVYENQFAEPPAEAVRAIRYEDFITHGADLAAEWNSAWGLNLAWNQSRDHRSEHQTSRDTSSSMGRWQRETWGKGVRELLEAILAPALREQGYPLDVSTPRLGGGKFRELVAPPIPLQTSPDGVMESPEGEDVPIHVGGPDYWIELPAAPFAAKSVSEIWVCLQARVGSLGSVYWRGPREPFAEPRSVHQAYFPGEHWEIQRFRVAGHPLWKGTIEQLRLDLFNHPSQPGIGRVRWWKLIP